MKNTKRAFLVYQAGIANVFTVDCLNLASYGGNAKRVFQGDFYGAVQFSKGLGIAGYIVRTAHCNQAGDIAESKWSENLEDAPFADKLIDLHIN